jgi:hypothetical protein
LRYSSAELHAEVLPAASVALAYRSVAASTLTVTVIPGVAKLAALPVASGMPEQSEVA